jgi:hypothetical protein
MAAVDDEDEDEEAEGDELDELIVADRDGEDLGGDEGPGGAAAAAAYRAAHRVADDRTEEELAKYIEERYR